MQSDSAILGGRLENPALQYRLRPKPLAHRGGASTSTPIRASYNRATYKWRTVDYSTWNKSEALFPSPAGNNVWAMRFKSGVRASITRRGDCDNAAHR